ncbi:hypothetical protein IKE96_01035 [bacterium]|nr:hypothetical protein [bacterium]
MKVRLLIFDENFINNIPKNLLNKLIHLKEPIPMRIRSVILDHYHDFNRQRFSLFGDDDKFMDQEREERFISRGLPPIESREYHNDLALEFIDKHPEFAPIIKEVKYIEV